MTQKGVPRRMPKFNLPHRQASLLWLKIVALNSPGLEKAMIGFKSIGFIEKISKEPKKEEYNFIN